MSWLMSALTSWPMSAAYDHALWRSSRHPKLERDERVTAVDSASAKIILLRHRTRAWFGKFDSDECVVLREPLRRQPDRAG
jgi:hypothetical protein